MFHIIFWNSTQIPAVFIFDEKNNVAEIHSVVPKEDEDLLGYQVFDLIFIFPQSRLSMIRTIFHEILHWINWKTLDKTFIDDLIEKVVQ